MDNVTIGNIALSLSQTVVTKAIKIWCCSRTHFYVYSGIKLKLGLEQFPQLFLISLNLC